MMVPYIFDILIMPSLLVLVIVVVLLVEDAQRNKRPF